MLSVVSVTFVPDTFWSSKDSKLDKEGADPGWVAEEGSIFKINSTRLKSCVCPLFLPDAFWGCVEPKIDKEDADAGRMERMEVFLAFTHPPPD